MTDQPNMDELRKEFTAWVATKPADEQYSYDSNEGCAFAQFMTTQHPEMQCVFVGGTFWIDAGKKRHDFCIHGGDDEFALALQARTFGQLLNHLNS